MCNLDFGDKVSAPGVVCRLEGFWKRNDTNSTPSTTSVIPCTIEQANVVLIRGNFFDIEVVTLVSKDPDFSAKSLLEKRHEAKLANYIKNGKKSPWGDVSVKTKNLTKGR